MDHIFTTGLVFRKVNELASSSDHFYDPIAGFWRSKYDNSLFVESKQFEFAASKKRDVETGEDQK